MPVDRTDAHLSGSTLGLFGAKLLYTLQLIAVSGEIEGICALSPLGARIRYW
jgi:hypothetical protein